MTAAQGIVLARPAPACDSLAMSATAATAEVFATAFKALQPRQREAVLERMLEDDAIAAAIADTLALEARRQQPRESSRRATAGAGFKASAASRNGVSTSGGARF